MNGWFVSAIILGVVASLFVRLAGSPAEDARVAGARAWRAGNFEQAAEHWRNAGPVESASAAQLHDRILAELRAGRPRDVEALVTRFEMRAPFLLPGPKDGTAVELARCLRGHADWTRGVAAETLSLRPEAGVPEIDAAILAFTRARDHWRAVGRDDLSRVATCSMENVALAEAKIAALEARRREAATKGAGAGADQMERRRDRVDAEGPTEEVEQDAPGPPPELGPDEIRRLLERLAEKEAEKRDLRRDRRAARRRPGERDW